MTAQGRGLVAGALGLIAGAYVSGRSLEALKGSPAWPGVVAQSPRSAQFVRGAVALPFPFALASLAMALMTFMEVHLPSRAGHKGTVILPPFPFDPRKTQLILGEEHNVDGTRSDRPTWRCLPEKGMTTGILITGATGAAKTSAGQYPYTAQLIRLHADDPEKKLGGLIIDAKGNYADFVRDQCVAAGRLEDYYEVSVHSGVYYNILNRPELPAAALGGHIGDMLRNVQGESRNDPFWAQSAKELATQTIRLVRLSQGREPTMVDLYRLATDGELYDSWLELARQRVEAGRADHREYQALEFWKQRKWNKLKDELRASIAAGLNNVCSLFDAEDIRRAFCPGPDEQNFLGFDELIAQGKIVALRLPYSELKLVSSIVGTMVKLNFFDAVLQRLSTADAARRADVGRPVFFVADEYDGYITQPGDGNFLSKCREARCCSIIATQSYESFVAKLHDPHLTAQLLANLRTKIWLCAEDTYTAKEAAALCGQVEKEKVSRNWSESQQSAWSFLDGRFVSADPGSMSETTTVNLHREDQFPPRCFTSLKKNQAIAKIFDGERVLTPRYLYLKPVYEDPNVSWFDTPTGQRDEEDDEKPPEGERVRKK